MYTAEQGAKLPCHMYLSQCFTLMNGIDSLQEQPLHMQKYYEILYIVSGQGYINVNSQKLFLSTGDYVILRPGDQHTLKAKNNIRYYSLEFIVQDSISEQDQYSEIRKVFIQRTDTSLTSGKNIDMKSVFENLFKEWHYKRPLYIFYITLLFQQILIQCCRTCQDRQLVENSETPENEHILDNFLSFINTYMDKPDVLSIFEKTYGVNRTVLTQLSKQKFGKTIFQLYTEKRFEYALNLLADRQNSITDIARSCAFSSVAAFSKAFSHYYGMSPSRYIQEHTQPPLEIPTNVYTDFSLCSQLFVDQPINPDTTETYTNPKMKLI